MVKEVTAYQTSNGENFETYVDAAKREAENHINNVISNRPIAKAIIDDWKAILPLFLDIEDALNAK